MGLSTTELWKSFGINQLLRYPFADVPAVYAREISAAAASEVGIRTKSHGIGKGRVRLTRTGAWR